MPRSQIFVLPPTSGSPTSRPSSSQTRGERLILANVWGGEGGPGEFLNEVLGVLEINSDNQIAAIVLFDLDDFDSALAELDARYLAGEAAAHARTWSVITRATPRNQGTSCPR